ncbi:MAG: hypothetical protein MUQ00_12730 [Candidatus Aminicenantes bacterium]|nr:hypothetical protein [Candidatus Aminicenantes bacterium]
MLANTGGQATLELLASVIVLLIWLLPVLLGVQAAKAKGRSPHWMWFGLFPLTGWIAYLWLQYGAQPTDRQIAILRGAENASPQNAPPTPSPTPPERVIVGACEACNRPLRVRESALSTDMRLTCKCGHLNVVRNYGQCSTCRRLVHAEQAHLRVSYYDMEEYQDLYCPDCFREDNPSRGRLLVKGGGKLYRSGRGA